MDRAGCKGQTEGRWPARETVPVPSPPRRSPAAAPAHSPPAQLAPAPPPPMLPGGARLETLRQPRPPAPPPPAMSVGRHFRHTSDAPRHRGSPPPRGVCVCALACYSPPSFLPAAPRGGNAVLLKAHSGFHQASRSCPPGKALSLLVWGPGFPFSLLRQRAVKPAPLRALCSALVSLPLGLTAAWWDCSSCKHRRIKGSRDSRSRGSEREDGWHERRG